MTLVIILSIIISCYFGVFLREQEDVQPYHGNHFILFLAFGLGVTSILVWFLLGRGEICNQESFSDTTIISGISITLATLTGCILAYKAFEATQQTLEETRKQALVQDLYLKLDKFSSTLANTSAIVLREKWTATQGYVEKKQ